MAQARDIATIILVMSLGALSAALVAQFGFGLLPCPLCLYQRVPYVAAAAIALVMLLVRPGSKLGAALVGLCALAFFAGASIALFHVGVEQHWWQGLASCTSQGIAGAQSVEDLAALLSKPVKIASCDSVQWSMFGVSMAGYNLLASVALSAFTAGVALKTARQGR